jgi:hypothetical protein
MRPVSSAAGMPTVPVTAVIPPGYLPPPFPGCLVTAEIPASGRVSPDRPAGMIPGSDYYAITADLTPFSAVGYECTCEPGIRPDQITEPMALNLTRSRLLERKFTPQRMSFAPNTALGKTLHAIGTSPSPWGDLTMEFQLYYLPRCVVVAFSVTSTQATESAKARAAEILKNVRRVDLAAPAPTPTSAPSPVPSEAAERLRVLNNLRDQGLITPAEYETRRKAVLDSL